VEGTLQVLQVVTDDKLFWKGIVHMVG